MFAAHRQQLKQQIRTNVGLHIRRTMVQTQIFRVTDTLMLVIHVLVIFALPWAPKEIQKSVPLKHPKVMSFITGHVLILLPLQIVLAGSKATKDLLVTKCVKLVGLELANLIAFKHSHLPCISNQQTLLLQPPVEIVSILIVAALLQVIQHTTLDSTYHIVKLALSLVLARNNRQMFLACVAVHLQETTAQLFVLCSHRIAMEQQYGMRPLEFVNRCKQLPIQQKL
jgi:hypothetical protein